jgi:hypothetical protein
VGATRSIVTVAEVARADRSGFEDEHARTSFYLSGALQFGQRQLPYERHYAGDPVRTAATLYRRHDAAPLLAYIARPLGQETATPTPR